MNAIPSMSVLKLVLCNGLGIATAVVSVTISALAAQAIGWEGSWATVPYGFQFLTILVVTIPGAWLMQRLGRKPVFLGASVCGVLAGVCGALAMLWANPWLLCLAHGLLGVNLASVNFYRFAALEVATKENKAAAMSLVVFGGTFAAFLGPAVARDAGSVLPGETFVAAYWGVAVLVLVIGAILTTTPFARPARHTLPRDSRRQAWRTGLRNPVLWGGMLSAALGYGVMNMLMVSASISMNALHTQGVACFSFHSVATAIQYHVLAMFVPSLLMGKLIQRFGAQSITQAGTVLLMGAASIAILDPATLTGFQGSLIVLGLGWNMMYVGGSFLVTQHAPQELAIPFQGANDFVVGVLAMLGAFAPGLVIEVWGWQGANALVLGSVGVFLAVLVLLFRPPWVRRWVPGKRVLE